MTPVLWLSPSLVQPRGRQVAMPWSAFSDRVTRAKAASSKDALHRWAPVEFRDGYRCGAGVQRVHALVLDVDDGTPIDAALATLDGFFVIAHTTFSATPEAHRSRIVAPLDRPVRADEYERVWRWVAMRLERAGVVLDYAARNPAQPWAVPARPPSGFYLSRVIDGAFVPVDEAPATIPKPEPLPMPERTTHDDIEHRAKRASKYLATMPGAISGSGGHAATFKAAVVLVRGFSLPPDEALRLLVEIHNPVCAPAWTVRELRHKVKQAYQRARVPFGAIADRPRAGRVA